MEFSDLGEGVQVSKLQFGCSRLGKAVKEDTTKIAPKILNQAFESGINFFDTAANYSYGNSEKILGDFIKDKQDQVVVSTKGGTMISNKAKAARFLSPVYNFVRPIVKSSKALKKHSKRFNFDHGYLSETLDRSLERLQRKSVDIYMLHNPIPQVLEDVSTNKLLASFRSEGKAKLTGYSLNKVDHAHSMKSLDDIQVLQVPFNYYNYNSEHHDILLDLRSKGIKLVVRAPFERGLLTPYNEVTTGGKTGKKDEDFRRRKEALKLKFGISEVQLALWFLKDLDIADSILFSSFNSDHLKNNIEVAVEKIHENFSWKDLVDH